MISMATIAGVIAMLALVLIGAFSYGNALPYGSQRDLQVQECMKLLNVTNAFCQHIIPGYDPNLQSQPCDFQYDGARMCFQGEMR